MMLFTRIAVASETSLVHGHCHAGIETHAFAAAFFFTLLHAEAASKPSVTKLKKASDQL
jgi:hypothetical protein